jgi:hypothetical protein
LRQSAAVHLSEDAAPDGARVFWSWGYKDFAPTTLEDAKPVLFCVIHVFRGLKLFVFCAFFCG